MMKKLIYIIPIMLLFITLGCSKRQHVFHTYYGDIDIDTMEVGMWDADGSPCYTVYSIDPETAFKTGDYAAYGSVIIYYNTKVGKYYEQFPSNDEYGNVVVDFNPYLQEP